MVLGIVAEPTCRSLGCRGGHCAVFQAELGRLLGLARRQHPDRGEESVGNRARRLPSEPWRRRPPPVRPFHNAGLP
eukprot:6108660-Alexandrium_andersonii.AAC.1